MSNKAEWLLVKRGLYYRPGSAGYTGRLDEAGRFTHAYAASCVETRGEPVSMIHEKNAGLFSPKCCDEVKLQYYREREEQDGRR